VTIPVAVIGAFIGLGFLGFSVNVLTLLAVILAIGLVVDDAIVMLENIQRRIDNGEAPLLAAYHGARQVAFAVIATTVTLVAVFVPISFMGGNVGRAVCRIRFYPGRRGGVLQFCGAHPGAHAVFKMAAP